MTGEAPDAAKGDQFRHEDGTLEVVFATEDGRVLTVREYPDGEAFEAAVDSATSEGTHQGVVNLPGASAFVDGPGAEGGEEDGNE